MISEIHIKNFGIIETAQVNFQNGFHVISGETGAGKSILLQAVAFVLGARADADLIRSGASEAKVTLVFDDWETEALKEKCREWGIEADETDGRLIFRRDLMANGRSRAFLNDQTVTLKTLQALGEALVHQVGQHAAQHLFEENFLLKLFDAYGKYPETLAEYREALAEHQRSLQELSELQERVTKTREQQDFFRFQCEELEKADLKLGEEEELEHKKDRLKHRVSLAGHAFELTQGLTEGEEALSDRLGKLLTVGQKARSLDASLAPVLQKLEEALEHIDAAGRQISDYAGELNEDPEVYDRVENRLALIHELKRKYASDVSGLIEKFRQLKTQLSELNDSGLLLQEKEAETKKIQARLKKLGLDLHKKRQEVATRLGKNLEKTLRDLALAQAKISWRLILAKSVEDYRSSGPDRLELWVSFNPGEELRPCQEVISGGELSRLLLALYEILFPADQYGTFIFDEVDAGVGGRVAELIGRKLEKLSRSSQVFCVTHLPQIACQGHWHYQVLKTVKSGRTFSEIRLLKNEERIREVARMLAGVEVTAQALQHAKELLKGNAA